MYVWYGKYGMHNGIKVGFRRMVWYVRQRSVACGSICEHLESFGSIWGVLWLMQQNPIWYVCMYVWYGMVWYA